MVEAFILCYLCNELEVPALVDFAARCCIFYRVISFGQWMRELQERK